MRKSSTIIALVVFMMLPCTISAVENRIYLPVQLMVNGYPSRDSQDDLTLKVYSFVTRELRSLGDITIVDYRNVIPKHFPIDIHIETRTYTQGNQQVIVSAVRTQWQYKGSENIGFMMDPWLYSESDIRKFCTDIVVFIDNEVFNGFRKGDWELKEIPW